MSKNKKSKEKKDNGVHVIDKTGKKEAKPSTEDVQPSAEKARVALAALSEEERAAVLKDMGFSARKVKGANGPDPSKLFKEASEKLFAKMPEIKNTLEGCTFPGSFSLTVGVDPKGLFFSNLRRVREPYGPRKSKT